MARSLIHCAECGRNRLLAAKGLCQQCYFCQWCEEHPGYHREYSRRYHAAHREERTEYNREAWEQEVTEYYRPLMKHCRKCDAELVVGETWYPSNAKQHSYICTECVKANVRQWQKANPDKTQANNRQWQKANPNYDRQYRAEHREERKERARQWRKDNADRARAYNHQYQKAHRAERVGYTHRRNALMADLPATLTTEQWQEILESYGHACAYCGATGVPLEQEHMIPVSRGGGYTAANIVPACGPCNSRKGTKTAEEFMA